MSAAVAGSLDRGVRPDRAGVRGPSGRNAMSGLEASDLEFWTRSGCGCGPSRGGPADGTGCSCRVVPVWGRSRCGDWPRQRTSLAPYGGWTCRARVRTAACRRFRSGRTRRGRGVDRSGRGVGRRGHGRPPTGGMFLLSVPELEERLAGMTYPVVRRALVSDARAAGPWWGGQNECPVARNWGSATKLPSPGRPSRPTSSTGVVRSASGPASDAPLGLLDGRSSPKWKMLLMS